MKSTSNIYDFDGEIIRESDDTHKWTVEEAQERMEYYRKKLENLDEKDPKAVVYTTYMRNLSNYIMTQYANMSKDELKSRLTQQISTKTTDEQIQNAIEDLKKGLEETDEGATEEVGESDPVRRDTVMDEYVDFEEIPV